MKRKATLTFFLFLFCGFVFTIQAQTKTVTGKVIEAATDLPAIGVTVMVKGTTNGTITSTDGTYELKNVAPDAVIQFSSVGMRTIQEPLNGRSIINVVIEEDLQALDEVVVVGYGTAKMKDLTSPIAVVKGAEIVKNTTTNPMQALQGKVAGVQIVNSGEPGAGPTVRIRGVGSFDKDKTGPLYVVDGMFFDNIDFLNNNDIQEMSILKDASAASIYGVRAANGVVIVTTKKGDLNSKATVTYDGYVGFQKAVNVLKMANSAQYATMQYEKYNATDSARVTNSINRYGAVIGPDGKPTNIPAVNTDWYDALLRTAFMQNHNLDITGGTNKASYSIGLNYQTQQGVMKANNDYKRFNMRARGDYQVFKWLKVGANIVLSDANRRLPNNDAWFYAFISPSLYPVYDLNNTAATPIKYGSIQDIGYDNYYSNPVAVANYYEKKTETFQVLPSFFADIALLPQNKLNFRTSLSQDISIVRSLEYTPVYTVGGNQQNLNSRLVKTNDFYNNYIWDNTLTYKDQFGVNNLSVMLGHSMRGENWRQLEGSAENVPGGEPEYKYISQGTADSRRSSDNGTSYNGISFFGRVMYDYAGKYLLSATMRADGSSKYQEKWGYFPSVGVGWVMSEEDFMSGQRVFDYLKIRGSWGKLGNDKIQPSDGFASIETGLDASGVFGDVLVPGYINQSYFSYLRWEVVDEVNAGFDAGFLNNRLSAEFDYYRRVTKNAVIATPLPMGAGELLGNNGKILNEGFEITLNWSDKIGSDFRYNIGLNFSTLRNRVQDLNGTPYIYGGSAEFRTITKVGEAINSFYGLKQIGVYQTQEQIDADTDEGRIARKYGLKPGDFIYEDLNGDGSIDDQDRQIIGDALPNFTYGGSLGFEWKNVDFGLSFMGVTGNQIVNEKRGIRRYQGDINYDREWVENRWTGAGTSNTYPSAEGSVNPWNIAKFSSFLIEKGAYFRIQNIQVGYTFQHIGQKGPKLRLSITAERPFTAFSSNGFTPEIADGFDRQVYPLAASYSFGVRLTY